MTLLIKLRLNFSKASINHQTLFANNNNLYIHRVFYSIKFKLDNESAKNIK